MMEYKNHKLKFHIENNKVQSYESRGTIYQAFESLGRLACLLTAPAGDAMTYQCISTFLAAFAEERKMAGRTGDVHDNIANMSAMVGSMSGGSRIKKRSFEFWTVR